MTKLALYALKVTKNKAFRLAYYLQLAFGALKTTQAVSA